MGIHVIGRGSRHVSCILQSARSSLCACLLCSTMLGDEIQLKNGDRISPARSCADGGQARPQVPGRRRSHSKPGGYSDLQQRFADRDSSQGRHGAASAGRWRPSRTSSRSGRRALRPQTFQAGGRRIDQPAAEARAQVDRQPVRGRQLDARQHHGRSRSPPA